MTKVLSNPASNVATPVKAIFTVGSNILVAELILLFILFIAAKGNLGKYISFLTFTPASNPNPTPFATPKQANNTQQQTDPNNNAIPGVNGSGQPTLFQNSNTQAANPNSTAPIGGGIQFNLFGFPVNLGDGGLGFELGNIFTPTRAN